MKGHEEYKGRVIAKLDEVKYGTKHIEQKTCHSCGDDILVTFEFDQNVARSFCPSCESNNNYKRSDIS